MEGRENTNRLSDDITQIGDGPPSGGKRKLIRREGFDSRISYKDRPHDPGGGVGIARDPTSQDDMTRNLPKDTNMNRSNKPTQTPVGGAEMAKPAFNRQTQREMTTAAEVGRKLSDLTEPSLYQGGAVEAEGAVTSATLSAPHRCCDCGIQIVAGRNSVTDRDECREVRPSMTCQVIPKTAPLTDTEKRQYRLKSPAFVGSTDIQNARMLLEVPVLRMPNVFLKLAEEARKSVIVDDQLTDKKDVQSHRTGQAKPVFVTEILNSTPVVGSRLSRFTNPSTELTPDRNLAQPTIESGPVDRLSNTGQPVKLDVKMKQGASGPQCFVNRTIGNSNPAGPSGPAQ